MFSALRQRLYDYISRSRSRNVQRSPRGREQSPLRATRAGRVAKAGVTTLRKRKHALPDLIGEAASFNSSDDEETDSDGDTVTVKTENTAMTSVSPAPRKKMAKKPLKPLDPSNDDDDTDDDLRGSAAPKLTRTEETEHIFDIEAEGSVRRKELKLEEHPDWSQTEVDLFNKLNMRGFEPLLPKTWQMDFKTVPEGLFSLKDEEVFINSICGKDFRGELSLTFSLSTIFLHKHLRYLKVYHYNTQLTLLLQHRVHFPNSLPSESVSATALSTTSLPNRSSPAKSPLTSNGPTKTPTSTSATPSRF